MMPDPKEIQALDDAITQFEEAFTNLLQAARRIQRIYKIEKIQSQSKDVDQSTGSFCPRCYSTRTIIKGAGCIKCLDCHFDLGCGG